MNDRNHLKELAKLLGLKAIVANWDRYCNEPWLPDFLKDEQAERAVCSMERRTREANLGEFKPMADFDWNWPEEINRTLVEEILGLDFLATNMNVVFVGPAGTGKTMIAQNIGHFALARGMKTLFVQASEMLSHLSRQDGQMALARCLKKYCSADLLIIDEVGNLSYSNRFADLFFEVISGRYQKRSTIVTTNVRFQEWNSLFPNALCVSALVDRLVHKTELVIIKGKSYRHKESEERRNARAKLQQPEPDKAPPRRKTRKEEEP